MVIRFGSYHSTRSHLSFLPRRRIGVVAMSSAGPSVVTDIIAAFAYDLEAGKPDAHKRADERMTELRKRVSQGPKALAAEDSTRTARQRVPLGRPLTDFAGVYAEPSYGRIAFTVSNGRLAYRWGALYGPAEIYDATKGQMRIEIAGSGNVATFNFAGAGPARSLELQGVTFSRAQ